MDDLEELENDYPGWHAWAGVNGQLYARRERSSPPIVFRAQTMEELREQVRQHIAARQP